MSIKIVPDLVAPATVFAADWGTSYFDERSTGIKLNRPVGLGICALGYILGGWLGWGGDFTKNLGIASFDWAANSVVGWIKERAPAGARMERIPVHHRLTEPAAPPSSPLQRSYQPEFRKASAW